MLSNREKPERAKGAAIVDYGEGVVDDFTLPESLYIDSVYFYKKSLRESDVRAKNRYLRASLSSAFRFSEALLNQIAFGYAFAHGEKIKGTTKDVLEEKETSIDNKGNSIRKNRYYSFEDRFSFLTMFLTGEKFDRSGQLWSDFMKSKKLRDLWTHPKPPFEWTIDDNEVKTAIITLREMFIKLSDMMGLENPVYLREFDVVMKTLGDE